MSKMLVAVCFVLAMVSVSYAGVGDVCPYTGLTVQEVIGNWETDDPTPGWTAASYAYMEVIPGPGNTAGTNSLFISCSDQYWGLNYAFPIAPTTLANAHLCVDVTTTAAQDAGTGWSEFAQKISVNSDGPSGYQEYAGTWYNRADGSPAGSDWGPWYTGTATTGVFDLSNYNITGATWCNIWFAMQGWTMPGAQIDNVEICCPEPATMALLGLGGLALIRRKK